MMMALSWEGGLQTLRGAWYGDATALLQRKRLMGQTRRDLPARHPPSKDKYPIATPRNERARVLPPWVLHARETLHVLPLPCLFLLPPGVGRSLAGELPALLVPTTVAGRPFRLEASPSCGDLSRIAAAQELVNGRLTPHPRSRAIICSLAKHTVLSPPSRQLSHPIVAISPGGHSVGVVEPESSSGVGCCRRMLEKVYDGSSPGRIPSSKWSISGKRTFTKQIMPSKSCQE